MKTYKELKRQQMLKQITEEEYQKGKDAIIESIAKKLINRKDSGKTE